MVLDKNDKDVSQQILQTGWYADEMFETKVFMKQLKKGLTVLDLGANIGFYTLLARSMVGETGLVVAFEPFPKNVTLLKKSIKINKYQNVVIVPAAVSDRSGDSTLHLSPDHNSEHSLLRLDFNYPYNWRKKRQIPIRTVTVDKYMSKYYQNHAVDVIKMDIEGFETRALMGMKETIESNKNMALLTEFWPSGMIQNGSSAKEFLETLEHFGFKIFHIDDTKKKVYPVRISRVLDLMRTRSIAPEDETMKVWGWYSNLLCIKTKS